MKFKTLDILGKTYTLLPMPDKWDNKAMGEVSDDRVLIKYWVGQAEETLKDTILHEAIHALDYNAQIGLKERQVHVLAGMILHLLRANPKFAQWLLEKK